MEIDSCSLPERIGTPGQAWGAAENATWLSQMSIKRSYAEEVLQQLEPLKEHFDVFQYGALSHDPARYPLMAVKSRDWAPHKPYALVTGGVHGYETSGVQGAIRFLQTQALPLSHQFNLLVAPCISPWSYETVQRWNAAAIDPNRSFQLSKPDADTAGSSASWRGAAAANPAEESAAFVQMLASLDPPVQFVVHIDLHETTDSDESEFRPRLAWRDGEEYVPGIIPDGFFLCGDSESKAPGFHKAIIESVRRVAHIAPAEADGTIIGEQIGQEGCITYPTKELGLCISSTEAPYKTTTEVYPDSAKSSPEQCVVAQVAAVTAGLEFILNRIDKRLNEFRAKNKGNADEQAGKRNKA